jgi:hypothetical protein
MPSQKVRTGSDPSGLYSRSYQPITVTGSAQRCASVRVSSLSGTPRGRTPVSPDGTIALPNIRVRSRKICTYDRRSNVPPCPSHPSG